MVAHDEMPGDEEYEAAWEYCEDDIQAHLDNERNAQELLDDWGLSLPGSVRMKIAGASGRRNAQAWEADFGVPIPVLIRRSFESLIEWIALEWTLRPEIEAQVRQEFGVEFEDEVEDAVADEIEERLDGAVGEAWDAWCERRAQREREELLDLLTRPVADGQE